MLKYFKLFDLHSDYESYINSEDKLLPNLSYCEDEFHHHFKHFFHDISLYGDVENINLENYYKIKHYDDFHKDININPGYCINDISILMNNIDITEDSYNNDSIDIIDVSANVNINVDTGTVLNASMFTKRTTADGIVLGNNKAALESINGNTLIFLQKLTNPDFNNNSDWEGRLGYNNTVSISNSILTVTSNGTSDINVLQDSIFTEAHKYLCVAKVRLIEGTTGQNFKFGNANNSYNGAKLDELNKWYTTSYVINFANAPDTAGNKRFILKYTTSSTIEVDWAQCIDLTCLNTSLISSYGTFKKYFPLNIYDKCSVVLNNNIFSYISKDIDEEILQTSNIKISTLKPLNDTIEHIYPITITVGKYYNTTNVSVGSVWSYGTSSVSGTACVARTVNEGETYKIYGYAGGGAVCQYVFMDRTKKVLYKKTGSVNSRTTPTIVNINQNGILVVNFGSYDSETDKLDLTFDTLFPYGLKSSKDNEGNLIYDEIINDNGIWKAIMRIGNIRTLHPITNINEYNILEQEETYIIDNQEIPKILNVINGGIEEITPIDKTIPETSPTIMNIRYGVSNSQYSIVVRNAKYVNGISTTTVPKNGSYTSQEIIHKVPGLCVYSGTILMGGTDISSTAWNNRVVNIPQVTGNVNITVNLTSVTDTNMFTKRTTGNGITILNDKALLKGVSGNTMIWKQDAYFGGQVTYNDTALFTNIVKGSSSAATDIYYDAHFTGNGTGQINLRNTLTVGHIYILTITLKFPNSPTPTTTRFVFDQATSDGATPTAIQTYNVINGEVNITRRISVGSSGTRLAMKFTHGSTSPNNWIPEGQDGIDFQFRNVNAFDLTAMFGAGNEPTVAEFEKLFPIGQYNYTSGIVLNNSMTNYISKRYDAVGVTPLCNATNITWINAPASGAGQTQTPVNGVFTLTVETTNVAKIRPKYDLTRDTTHKFYWRCYVKAPHGYFIFGNYGGTLKTVTLENNGIYERVSYLNTGAASRTDFTIASGTSGETIYIKNPLVVDLTEMFGAGNEPTLEVCNTIFDGIPNWQTKDDFDNWNILQNTNINVANATGKLNGEGESVVIFPNGMKSSEPVFTAELDYVETTGSQRVVTNYVPTGTDIVIKAKIRPLGYSDNTTSSTTWFGVWGSKTESYGIRRYTTNNNIIGATCGTKGENIGNIASVVNDTDYIIELSYNTLKLNEDEYSIPTIQGTTNTSAFTLFNTAVKMRFYWLQIYKAGDLILDLVPVRKEGVGCIYDNISGNVFLSTGTLVCGNDTTTPVNTIRDEIYYDNQESLWKAIRRVGNEIITPTAGYTRSRYNVLENEEVYTLDDQTIPTEITVADQGIEEILPTNGATPTTAPAIMEIQFGGYNE